MWCTFADDDINEDELDMLAALVAEESSESSNHLEQNKTETVKKDENITPWYKNLLKGYV